MSDKPLFVSLKNDPNFLERVSAVLANTTPLSTTTVVVPGMPPELSDRRRQQDAVKTAPVAAAGTFAELGPETNRDESVGRTWLRVRTRDAAPSPRLTLEPAFKYSLAASVGLTALMVLTCVVLALFGPDTDAVKGLLNICEHLLSLGCGGVFSLLGSKAGPTLRSSRPTRSR
jgi:hypothetical protein